MFAAVGSGYISEYKNGCPWPWYQLTADPQRSANLDTLIVTERKYPESFRYPPDDQSSKMSAPLHIGVMIENVQLSDIAGIDCFGNLTPEYVKVLAPEFNIDMRHLAQEIVFHYISSTMSPAFMTSSISINPSDTYESAPRDLDVLLIGGPPLEHRPAAAAKFMTEAVPRTKIVMTTCVGSLWLASTGVLEGKKCTTNRGLLDVAKKLYPKIEWFDKRWVVDGKFWTLGGAGAGIDMVASYTQEHFDKQLVEMSLSSMDFVPEARGVDYA